MNNLKSIIIILTGIIFLSSCDPIGEEESEKGAQFLILHLNSSDKLADGAYLSVMEVKKGEADYEMLNEAYPPQDLRSSVDIANSRVVIGLHNNFNTDGSSKLTNGGWFDINSPDMEFLPLVPSGSTSRISYYETTTSKVSESGHIFYLSASNDKNYFDQYRSSLVRYTPKTDDLEIANDPDGFILIQPEKGWDTETSMFVRQFYSSEDGRYVFGVLSAYGVDGGSYHYDYEILFKYDFDKGTYTRLGDTEDKHVGIMGITSDRNYVAYTSKINGSYIRKIVNVSTNSTSVYSESGGQGYSNTTRWNSSGYCSGETNRTIGIYNMRDDEYTEIRTPSRPYYAQFSAGGGSVYFMIESSSAKYLCKTSDLTEEATIDTVCSLQSDVYEFMVIK